MSKCFLTFPCTMLFSMPCMLPTAGARMSTPVDSTYCFASTGVVRPFDRSGASSCISEPVPMSPISPSASGRIDRFESFDRLFGLAHVLLERQGGNIEDNGIDPWPLLQPSPGTAYDQR